MGFSFRLAAVKGKAMGLSFRLAVVKGLRKKRERSKIDESERPRKRIRATIVKPDSKFCGFDMITEDLLMKILTKLPAKLVTRLMCVSNHWYSVIASQYFTKFFLESPSSVKRPRLVLSMVDKEDRLKYGFLSSSPHDHLNTSVSVLDQSLNMPGMGGNFVNALRGLLCVRLGRRLRISNLTTKQRVTLPIVRSRLLPDNIWNYFGYDSVYDEYKVLSTVWEVNNEEGIVRSEHQVLVLGPGTYWRSTYSTIPPLPHRPYSQGISINGVLHYGAWIDNNKCVVMSFDLNSEEFNLIELPVEADIIWHTYRANLMNYRGKLAVFEYSQLAFDASVDMWVMEDAIKSAWSKETLVLPLSDMNFVHGDQMGMLGMSRCDEVMLIEKNIMACRPFRCVIYDLEKNKITRNLEIVPPLHLSFWGIEKGLATFFWEDDTESIMYLET